MILKALLLILIYGPGSATQHWIDCQAKARRSATSARAEALRSCALSYQREERTGCLIVCGNVPLCEAAGRAAYARAEHDSQALDQELNKVELLLRSGACELD